MFPEYSGLRGAAQIGEGGSGSVYSAYHSKWGQVAVKVAIDSTHGRDNLFPSEYTLLRSLSHPGIVKLYDFGQALDQRHFIIMELLTGGDLYSWADGQPVHRRFQPLGTVISALNYIHTLGIIHHDLKGENILLDGSFRPRVTDLGLAISGSGRNSRAGTLEYMAPEVIDNQEATAAADIYSLGVILFRLATGRLPFEASDPLQIISLKQNPDELDGKMIATVVSVRFAEMVRQCLDPDPALRPRSMTEIAEQLFLANLVSKEDVNSHSINHYLHHHIYSYNTSYARQEFRNLAADYLIMDSHQGAATGLLETVADTLKTSGCNSILDSTTTLSYIGTDSRRHTICLADLANSPIAQTTIEYPELDRFAFDAILEKLFTGGVDDTTIDLLYRYSGGNISLLKLLLNGLEQQSLVDLKTGRILLQRDRLFEFEPTKDYLEAVAAMLPELSGDLAKATAFLSADPDGHAPFNLLETSNITKKMLSELADLGVLKHDDYRFAHSYYREYYYHSLSRKERAAVHQEWVAQLDGGLVVAKAEGNEQLFHHLAGAVDTERAIEMAIALVERCREGQQPDKARMLLTRVSVLPISSVGFDLQLSLLMISARMYKDAGDFRNALANFASSVRLAKRTGNKAILAKAYQSLGDIYKSKRDYRRGNSVLDRAVRLWGELGDELELSHCFNNIGNIHWIVGDLDGAAVNYETALEVQRRLGAQKDAASSLNNLGGIKLVQHQYHDSIALYNESIAIKREVGDWPELARTANNLAVAHYEMNELQVANDYLNESLRINLSLGAKKELLYNYENLHEVELRRGNHQKAREWLFAGFRLAKQNDRADRGNYATMLARLMLLAGRYGKTGRLLDVATHLERQVDDQIFALKLSETTAEYHLLLRNFEQAHAQIAKASVNAAKLGEFKSQVRLLLLKSRTNKASGAADGIAWESLTEAEKVANDLSMHREKLTIMLDKAEFLIESNRLQEAREEYTQVRLLPQFEGINTFQGRISFINGLIDLRSGQHHQAISLFNDAYLASKTMQMPESTWKTLVMLGETYQALTEYERAFKCYIEAFDIIKRLATGIADTTSKRRYLSDPVKISVADKLETISELAT